MTIVFVSNYFNHHQKPLCDALWDLTGGNFCFVQTRPMGQERKDLGYHQDDLPEYILSSWENRGKCLELVEQADAVIAGSAPEDLLKARIKAGKLTFRYCERILKKGPQILKFLPRYLRLRRNNPQGKPLYLLCAGGYVASDFRKFGLFRNRAYRWGYFPAGRNHPDFAGLLAAKKPHSILWAGRLIAWKHPELALEAVRILRDQGYVFTLDVVGAGPMETMLREQISRLGLTSEVRLLGPMPPEEVGYHMEKSQIFLCTSDRNEGWGAVVNEAMNAGCALVVSHQVGAAPYLIEHGKNGLLFRSGDATSLAAGIREYLENPELQKSVAVQACHTIQNRWNAELAAKRLIELIRHLQQGEIWPELWESGPLSREG